MCYSDNFDISRVDTIDEVEWESMEYVFSFRINPLWPPIRIFRNYLDGMLDFSLK